jgi:transketolase
VASERTNDLLCINTIRTLAIDAVQQAGSGHAGTPMAIAPVVYTLWLRFLRCDPANPTWPNRDRFILSAGHASVLLYALMEGVASEAASLAGHLKLANLCWIYDSNKVTIEGHTPLAFSEDVAGRFRAYGWSVLKVDDANDPVQTEKALEAFRATSNQPTLIIVDSIIGYGSPHKQNTAAAHSDPLGEEEVRLAKRFYGWPEEARFLVPDGVYERFRQGIGQRGGELHNAWNQLRKSYRVSHPDLADELECLLTRALPAGWDADIPCFPADAKGAATRDASGKVLNAVATKVPWLIGGSSDLAPSTKTKLTFADAGDLQPQQPGGRNLHFGVREHAMGTILNGLALSGLRPFGATFLVFSDYMRPSIRLAALMELPVLYVFTHDSIGVGEDGPTHQPVEQLVSLRAIPGLVVLRPADANEVAEAYRVALRLRLQPACLVLSRQALPVFDRTRYAPASGLARGAYILADAKDGRPEIILIGTGSEVQLCIEVYNRLSAEGVAARVVSMPSWELFELQGKPYQDSVLPPAITARLAVEQGAVIGWDRYVGRDGAVIGMHGFGASAPFNDLQTRFGFTPERVYEAAKSRIKRGELQ